MIHILSELKRMGVAYQGHGMEQGLLIRLDLAPEFVGDEFTVALEDDVRDLFRNSMLVKTFRFDGPNHYDPEVWE